jgi:replicative DNA helicase
MDKKRNRRVNFGSLDGGLLPPQDVAIEELILGVLMSIPDSFEIISELLKKEVFYKDSNQKIFQAISDLHKEKGKIDILTVSDKLRKSGELDSVGGPFAVTQLTNSVVSSAHLEYHSRLLVEKYLSREIIRISNEFQSKAYLDEEDIFDLLNEMHKEIDAIRNYGVDGEGEVPLAVSIEERVKEKEEMVRNKIEITGISTGNPKLDNLISGFNKGCVYVFAAAPSQGKSVKGLNYAKIAALQSNRVPVFSLEMSKRDYIDRFICEESKVPLGDYRANRITEYDMQKIKIAAKQLKSLSISIYDNPSANTNYIRKKIKVEIKKFGSVEMIVVDYAQLLKPNEKASSREQEVSNAVKDLKVIAKEFDIPVILLAQVGRDIYKAADRRPNLSMIRESAEIENSADFVSFIYRPSFYFDIDSHPDRNDMNSKIATIDQLEYDLLSELIVVKNRAGLPNVIMYEKFYGQFSCFTTDSLYNTTTPFIDEPDNSDINPAPF